MGKTAAAKIAKYFKGKFGSQTPLKNRRPRRIPVASREIKRRINRPIIMPAPVTFMKVYGSLKYVYDTISSSGSYNFIQFNGSSGATLSTTLDFLLNTGIMKTAWNSSHMVQMKSIYDKYRVLGFQFKIHQAGFVTQDDNTTSTSIPTPLAIGLNQTNVSTTYQDIVGTKPSTILSTNDKTLSYSLPHPVTYSDVDNNDLVSYPPVYLSIAPLNNATSSLEYYWEVAYKVQFTKQQVKLEQQPNIV